MEIGSGWETASFRSNPIPLRNCSLTYYEFCKTGVDSPRFHKTCRVGCWVWSAELNDYLGSLGFDCNTVLENLQITASYKPLAMLI
jgi:hypothetical protein